MMNELKRILKQVIETQTSDSECFNKGCGLCYILNHLHYDGQISIGLLILCNNLLKPYLEEGDVWLDVLGCKYALSLDEQEVKHCGNSALHCSWINKYSLKHAQGKLRQQICIEMLEMLEELES